jgi:hypothetical protein
LETSWPASPDGMAGSLPGSLRQLVEHQLERLTEEERRVLEAASVAGLEFSAHWVAAAMDIDVLEVEGGCEDLARRHPFLCAPKDPARPKRRLTERYRFLHALYPQILCQGLPAAWRRRLHRRVGESKETAFGSRSAEIAAELAVHFEEARDARRAVHYLRQAAQNALRRSAGQEAADLLTRALEQLQALPETPERAQQELSLQASLGAALLMSRGYTAPEVKHAYDRAYALSGQAGESPQIFPAWPVSIRAAAGRVADSALDRRAIAVACAGSARSLSRARGAGGLGAALFHLAEPAAARAHVEESLRVYDGHPQEALFLQLGEDPGVMCLRYAGFALQVLGYPDQALARSREARALAEALSHPFSLVGEVCSCVFVSVALRRPSRASTGGDRPRPGQRACAAGLGRAGGARAGLGARRAGTGRRGDRADAPRPGFDAYRRLLSLGAAAPCAPGRGVREGGSGERGVRHDRRGARHRTAHRGALVRRRAVSTQRGAHAPTVGIRSPKPRTGGGGRRMFSSGHRHRGARARRSSSCGRR